MADTKIDDLVLAAVSDSMQFESDIGGTTPNKVTATGIRTYVLNNYAHDALVGLTDDDHTQYSLADGTRWTTTPTINRAVISDASGNLVVSAVTSTELGYLDTVSSNIQTQFNAITSDISTINSTLLTKYDADSDVDHGGINGLGDDDHTQYSLANGTRWTTTPTANRVVISDVSGNLGVSTVTTTTLGYLDATSSIQTQLDAKYDAASDVDHGGVTGLSDDDHTQYSLADGTRWTTTPTASRVPISDVSGNLVVSSTTTTQLGYLDATSSIQTQLDTKYDADSDVDHDSTTNFVANEHIDHSSVTLTAGVGLTGGGTIAASRTFDLDINGLVEDTDPDIAADFLATYDGSASGHKKVELATLSQIKETSQQTSNYTLVLADAGKVVLMNGTSLTMTVPPNSSVAFPVGTVIGVYNAAATAVTLTQGAGVTIRNVGDLAQYQECSLRKRATDEWVAVGNIS